MSHARFVASLVLPAAALFAGCHHAEAPAPEPVVSVQAATVQEGAFDHWFRTEGELFPLQQAVLTPKITAPVAKFYVNRGSHVHAGEVLADLENKDLVATEQETGGEATTAEANYQTATQGTIPADLQKAQLDLKTAQATRDAAQKIYVSRQALYKEGALAQKDLNAAEVESTQAENDFQMAQQHLAALESSGHGAALQAAHGDLTAAQARAAGAVAEVSYSHIVSPIDGVVTDRPLWPGELATSTAPLITVMNISQVLAHVHVPAAIAPQIKVGDRASLTQPGVAAGFEGKVSLVSPATNPSSSTVEIWVAVDNQAEALHPGTTVNVAILLQTIPDALTVPETAILTDPGNGETTVMKVGSDSVAHQITVKVGVREPGTVEILEGLSAGDRVVTVGAYGLPDKTKVKVVTPPPPDDDEGGGAL